MNVLFQSFIVYCGGIFYIQDDANKFTRVYIALKRFLSGAIFNNYWTRLSGISRIIEITLTEASIILDIPRKPNSIIILLFTWHCLSFILCTNYCLELFSFILCDNKKTDLLVLQTIICKCDVIITEYQIINCVSCVQFILQIFSPMRQFKGLLICIRSFSR